MPNTFDVSALETIVYILPGTSTPPWTSIDIEESLNLCASVPFEE